MQKCFLTILKICLIYKPTYIGRYHVFYKTIESNNEKQISSMFLSFSIIKFKKLTFLIQTFFIF
jgi:hypothetical protein